MYKTYFLLLVSLFAFQSLCSQSADLSKLTIEVQGLRNTEGVLSIIIFNSPEGFPEDVEKAFRWKRIEIRSETEHFHFENVPEGTYAFAILHDEDENGEMKKNFLGMPKEGFAFSNNYRPKVKNPAFEDAAFEVRGKTETLEIEMVYFL